MLVNFHGTSPTHTQLTLAHTHAHKNQPQNTWNSPLLQLNTLWILPLLRTPPLYSFPCWRWTLRSAGVLYALTGCCFRLLALFLFPLTHATCHSCCFFLLLLLLLWLLQCVLFRSITVTSARYLSVKTQTHVSTSRSHLLLLLFPHLSCLSLGRLISKAWNIFPPLLRQAHARAETPPPSLPHSIPLKTPPLFGFCSVKRRSFWLYLLLVLLPGKYKFNSFHITRSTHWWWWWKNLEWKAEKKSVAGVIPHLNTLDLSGRTAKKK